MTTLLAYSKNGRGYMAGDGRTTSGNEIVSETTKKIFRAGKWLIGSSGSHLHNRIVRRNLETLAQSEDFWAISRALKELLLKEGLLTKQDEDGGHNRTDGDFLVCSGEQCAIICSDMTPIEVDAPCNTGSGGSIGQGALLAYLETGMGAPEAMRRAIAVACARDRGSGGAIQVEEIGDALRPRRVQPPWDATIGARPEAALDYATE